MGQGDNVLEIFTFVGEMFVHLWLFLLLWLTCYDICGYFDICGGFLHLWALHPPHRNEEGEAY